MSEEQNPAPAASETPQKLGIKIEKPTSAAIHAFFPILLVVSLVLIGGTLWMLSLEYLGKLPAAWLRAALDNLVLAL